MRKKDGVIYGTITLTPEGVQKAQEEAREAYRQMVPVSVREFEKLVARVERIEIVLARLLENKPE